MVGGVSEPRARLQAVIDDARRSWMRTPFAWGKSDCLMALADIYREALGVDPGAHVRRRYRSERGATRVMGCRGVIGALGHVARRQRWPRIDPAAAAAGDLGAVRAEGVTVGAIRDRGGWLIRNDGGFSVMPTAVRAWKVC